MIQAAGRVKRMSDFDNLAKLIKLAAKTHEESYVTTEGTTYGTYNLKISEACDLSGKMLGLDDQHNQLANLMLFSCWNDALDWADKQIYPLEMKFVEACYRCANGLLWGDFGQELEGATDLAREFSDAADKTRKSLYNFGVD